MIERYLIKPFKIFNITDQSAFLYFSGGGVHLKNENLVKFLDFLKEQTKIIDKDTLHSLLNEYCLEPIKTTNFLIHEIGLLSLTDDHQFFKRIYLEVKDNHINNKIITYLNRFSQLEICSLESNQVQDNSFVFYFTSSHDSIEIKKLYKDFYSFKNVGFLTSYIIHNYLFIDNLYLPNRGWPCHFCFINRWIKDEYFKKGLSKNSWFYITNFLMKENIRLPLSLPSEDIDLDFVFFWLKQALNKVFDFNKTSKTSYDTFFTSIDLSNGILRRDINFHWPGCNCLTETW